ncbi:peptide ABC transporter substrate-binding protein [Acetobacterium paludosum]|uniref:Peptide ABC transporter substrate-binding protein n=1 Tax=Acetobacterium paludosum TaxID=52693 RepID=A0A923KY17_9FIRM|nr:ABC transporter substrate-binding protein [Acetobacterium paludosum]MBC3889071.1 peptide ABC transporter substrate-binding protein [Acetobacterium paludosum]
MNSKLKKLLCFGMAALMLVGSVGCSNVGASGKTNQTELKVAYGKDTNVISEKGNPDMLVAIFAGERLVEVVNGEVVPSIAESWEVKNDGSCISFKIKKGLKFSDGTDLTAKEVRLIFDRNIALKSFQWTEMDRVEKIEVPDDYTINFYYKDGMDGYIALAGFAEYGNTIIGSNSFQTPGDPTTPIVKYTSLGAWKISEYVKDQYTTFVPNENYKGDAVKLEKITVNTITDDEARVLAIQSGDVDVIVDYYHGGSAYTPRNLLSTLKEGGVQVLKQEMPMTTVLAFNYTNNDNWKNIKLRQVMNYAINKDEIAGLFDGWITPANDAYFSDCSPFTTSLGVQSYKYDPEKAKQLLAECGLTGFSPKMLVNSDNTDEVKMAELLKSMLLESGINLQLEVMDATKYADAKKGADWDVTSYYIGGPERRIYSRNEGRFDPSTPEFGASGCYTSETIVSAVQKAVDPFDVNERKAGFKEFYAAIDAEAACVPLYYNAVFVVAKDGVEGIKFIGTEPTFDNVTYKK